MAHSDTLPKLLTEETREKILVAVRAGAKPNQAVQAAGVALRTFQDWKVKGRNGNTHIILFLDQIAEAEAYHENSCVTILNRIAASSDLDAVLSILKLRYQWGTDMQALVDKMLTLAAAVISSEEYNKLEQAIIDGGLD